MESGVPTPLLVMKQRHRLTLPSLTTKQMRLWQSTEFHTCCQWLQVARAEPQGSGWARVIKHFPASVRFKSHQAGFNLDASSTLPWHIISTKLMCGTKPKAGEWINPDQVYWRRLRTDRVQVGALVFGPVTGVAEGLQAAGMLADVRFLARVAPQVDLKVLQAWKSFGAALKLTQNRSSHSVFRAAIVKTCSSITRKEPALIENWLVSLLESFKA